MATLAGLTADQIRRLNNLGGGWPDSVLVGDLFSRIVDPSKSSMLFEDWVSGSFVAIATYFWSSFSSGGGSQFQNTALADANHQGIVELRSGAAGATYSGYRLASGVVLGNAVPARCQCIAQVDVLATAGEDYVVRLGLGDTFNGNDHANGVYFEYNRSVGPNWLLKTASASSRTTLDTGVPVVAGQFYNLVWDKDDQGQIKALVDGVEVSGTITTNIPTSVIDANMHISRAAATLNRSLFVDLIAFAADYTASPR